MIKQTLTAAPQQTLWELGSLCWDSGAEREVQVVSAAGSMSGSLQPEEGISWAGAMQKDSAPIAPARPCGTKQGVSLCWN